MTQLQNFHRVFRNETKGYWVKVLPTRQQVDALVEAQKAVREQLSDDLSAHYGVSPKYRVQGSWAYGTCNQPAQIDQEMDLDYGVYLPAKVFSQQKSSQEAKQYFETAKKSLEKVCNKNGWTIITDNPNCLRFKGFMPNAHMDIPLYAVPDDMFDELEQNHGLLLEKSLRTDEHYAMDALTANLFDSVSFSESRLIDLSSIEMIHMAKSDGEWKASDCEKVRKWFQDECMKYPNGGLQLRSVVRYLKGWRDHHWKSGGPTSILLMIIATKCYQYIAGRDDQALIHVVQKLPSMLESDIFEPNIDGHQDENFNKSTPAQRKENAGKAKELLGRLISATQSVSARITIDCLIIDFGSRIPNDPELVSPEVSDPYKIIKDEPVTRAVAPAVILPQSGG